MSKIVWDQTGERYIEAGVDHGVLYPQNANGTYATGVAWNGLTGVTESPEGAEANDLWADNIKYASLRSAETFGGTIEAYQSPVEFDACDGSVEAAPGVHLGQQKRAPFGLVYRTKVGNDVTGIDGDDYKLHIIYNATASPSDRSYETINDSPDAITMSWEFDTNPVTVEGYKPLSTLVIDSRTADAAKLTALENLLFGTENADPTLPSPATVISMMGNAQSQPQNP